MKTRDGSRPRPVYRESSSRRDTHTPYLTRDRQPLSTPIRSEEAPALLPRGQDGILSSDPLTLGGRAPPLSEAGGAPHPPRLALLPHQPWASESSSECQGDGPCGGPCPDLETPSQGAQGRGLEVSSPGRGETRGRGSLCQGFHPGIRAQRVLGAKGALSHPKAGSPSPLRAGAPVIGLQRGTPHLPTSREAER